MFQLALKECPPCPDCGCKDSAILKAEREWTDEGPRQSKEGGAVGPWGGRYMETRKCRHCSKVWRGVCKAIADADARVNAVPLATLARQECPHCKSQNTVITSTRGRVRYHKCRTCAKNFKSNAA